MAASHSSRSRLQSSASLYGKLFLSTLSKAKLRRVLGNISLETYTSKTINDPKALMNEIDHIRTKGYSWDDEEFIDGMIALAVPIHDEKGDFVSSLAFHAPTQRLPFASAHQHLERLSPVPPNFAGSLLKTMLARRQLGLINAAVFA